MGKYLNRLCSPDTFGQAWHQFSKERGRWAGDLYLDQVRTNPVRYVGQLVEELRRGTYRPEPMACFDVDKGDGGTRRLCTSTLRDKLAQRAALIVLTPLGESVFLDSSYGYRPGCSVEMAVSRVREWVRKGHTWLVATDIRDCFENIPHAPLLADLHRLTGDPELVSLIQRWMQSGPNSRSPAGQRRGIAQGMVLSPFLSNVYLHRFDLALARKRIPLVRFADDLVALARDPMDARRVHIAMAAELDRMGLAPNPLKTWIGITNPSRRFLGRRLPKCPPEYVGRGPQAPVESFNRRC